MNYFFLATAFFAFHLLLAYLVDHISSTQPMVISSVVSVALVVSYLRLVVAYVLRRSKQAPPSSSIWCSSLMHFSGKDSPASPSPSFPIVTLFAVMQATGRIKWSEALPYVRIAPYLVWVSSALRSAIYDSGEVHLHASPDLPVLTVAVR